MTDRDGRGLGVALAGIGLTLGTVAVGSILAHKTRKGSAPDDAPDYTGRRTSGEEAIGRTVTIRKPREELYRIWRDFKRLPEFMENLERIDVYDQSAGRATWHIKAPAGQTVEVETEISNEEDGRLIAWRSVAGSDIQTTGEVTFEDAPGDRGTRVKLEMSYDAPGGEVGRTIAKLFLREPQVQARHDLKRFKMMMETGEIATSARTKDQTRAAQQENAA